MEWVLIIAVIGILIIINVMAKRILKLEKELRQMGQDFEVRDTNLNRSIINSTNVKTTIYERTRCEVLHPAQTFSTYSIDTWDDVPITTVIEKIMKHLKLELIRKPGTEPNISLEPIKAKRKNK